jgi:hypothetical protein
MTEQKPEKKVVSRTVATALGVIAIILAVGLVGAVADYTSIINGKDNIITTLTNQNNQLDIWLNGNKTLLTQIERWLAGNETLLDQTEANNTNLQNQVESYNSTINSLHSQISSLIIENASLTTQLQDMSTLEVYYNNMLNTTVVDVSLSKIEVALPTSWVYTGGESFSVTVKNTSPFTVANCSANISVVYGSILYPNVIGYFALPSNSSLTFSWSNVYGISNVSASGYIYG